jgi:HK97 family phage major capsid protein
MSAATLAQLRNQYRGLTQQMSALLDKATPDAMAQWKVLEVNADKIADEISTLSQHIIERAESVGNRGRASLDLPPIAGGIDTSRNLESWEIESSSADYARAFRNWTKGGASPRPLVSLRGDSPIIHEARTAGLYEGGAAAGETLVPISFQNELEIKMKYYSGMRQVCRILRTPTGSPMPWPIMDDTAQTAEVLSENSSTGAAVPTFSAVTLSSNLVSSKQVLVSVQLEQDAFTDIGAILTDTLSIRIGRLLNTLYTNGDGSSGIYGLLANFSSGNPSASGIVGNGNAVLAIGANANSGNGGDTDLTSVGTTDLVNLIDKLDYSYVRPTSKFMFHQSTLNYLRKVTDKYGRNLFNASMASDVPQKLFGFDYVVNNDMPKIGAGNISVVFGDFDKYILRDSLGITLVRFNELFMTSYQRGYQAFGRFDGKLLQPAAFSYLIHPDS